jgi:MmyB-like transcription regulator ligand binding domain/Helix-turn-helix domain
VPAGPPTTEYYTRLEQGRDHHPSAQVLDAVARALGLEEHATAYLHGLAGPAARRRRSPRRTERVRPSIQELIDSWPGSPAYLHGPYLDVLAANRLATAVSPMFTPGINVLREMLFDPAARELLADWETRVHGLISALRAMAGPEVDDPRLTELVGELELRYDKFAVTGSDGQVLVIYHAEPGSRTEEALSLLSSVAATTFEKRA